MILLIICHQFFIKIHCQMNFVYAYVLIFPMYRNILLLIYINWRKSNNSIRKSCKSSRICSSRKNNKKTKGDLSYDKITCYNCNYLAVESRSTISTPMITFSIGAFGFAIRYRRRFVTFCPINFLLT